MMPRRNSTRALDWRPILADRSASDNPADFGGRRERFRRYEEPVEIVAYLQRLATGWPERTMVAEHITQLLAALPVEAPHVLELCCGPGQLARRLLERLPTIHYTGVDISPPFLAYAREQLAPHAARVTLLESDLSEPTWLSVLDKAGLPAAQFHAIVSMQSLHDVGDEEVIARLYQQAQALLLPNGLLLNADLVVAAGEELPKNPGRRSIPRHLALLAAQGYAEPRCTFAQGNFGCVVAWRR